MRTQSIHEWNISKIRANEAIAMHKKPNKFNQTEPNRNCNGIFFGMQKHFWTENIKDYVK